MARALLVIGLLIAGTVRAQEPETGWVRVQTTSPDARLMVDGRPMPLGHPIAVEGPVTLELTDANAEAWQPRRTERTVEPVAGDTLEVTLDLPIRYRIESLPIGASVVHEVEGRREPLGTAPVVLDRSEPLGGRLVVEHPGFLRAELAPGEEAFNTHTVLLRPLEERAQQDAASGWTTPERSTVWMDYAAAGLALASAGVAIYYKFEADAVDDLYREPNSLRRGDPALKAEAERLDVYSLAALGAMQASLGFLAVRFVLR